jgi:hypothetical protein
MTHAAAAAAPMRSIRFVRLPIYDPFPSSWGHNCHKHFAALLSRASHFEENTSKTESKYSIT